MKSPAAKNLLIGEAIQFAQAETLGPTSALDGFQMIDTRHSVGRVQGLNGGIPVTDVYFYLTLSGSTWKVSALRSLALTGMIEAARQELQKKPKLTNQERQELANLNLTLSLDRELRIYFKNHRAQFDRILTLKNSEAQKEAEKLGLGTISKARNANVEILIGGITDNSVGYLYSPSNQPPKISDDEYIWIEKIADKWYLFRTT